MSQSEREKWDRKFSEADGESAPDPFYLKCITRVPAGGLAYDLACGSGRHTMDLVKRGFRVRAVDISEVALEKLQSRVTGTSVETISRDLEFEFPPDEPADLIVNMFFLHRNVIPWIRLTLKPGGHCIFKALSGWTAEKPFKLRDGELDHFFEGWEILDRERETGQEESEGVFIRRPASMLQCYGMTPISSQKAQNSQKGFRFTSFSVHFVPFVAIFEIGSSLVFCGVLTAALIVMHWCRFH